jgi:hypothetical protein
MTRTAKRITARCGFHATIPAMDIEAILNDLREERDQIQKAIAALQQSAPATSKRRVKKR